MSIRTEMASLQESSEKKQRELKTLLLNNIRNNIFSLDRSLRTTLLSNKQQTHEKIGEEISKLERYVVIELESNRKQTKTEIQKEILKLRGHSVGHIVHPPLLSPNSPKKMDCKDIKQANTASLTGIYSVGIEHLGSKQVKSRHIDIATEIFPLIFLCVHVHIAGPLQHGRTWNSGSSSRQFWN